jgi:phage FluMu gp28-like protein
MAAATYTRPPIYPKQRAAIFEPVDLLGGVARYAFIEASTKAGKTAGCLVWLLEQALKGRENWNYWWIAPVYGQAKIAFRRMKAGLPKALYKANEADLSITLLNGATMWFKSGEKPDNLYGEDVYAAVLDEASRMREESFFAIRSTLTATNGPLRAIGNVKGRKNWFYRLSRLAEGGAPGMSFSKLTAYDAVAGGVLKVEEVEDARRMLPDHVFRELYLAEPSDDGGNPFGLNHIAACVAPLSKENPVAFGVDLAKSQDWTVIIALDKRGRCCGIDRWQRRSWEDTTKELVAYIGHLPALVDSTGVGDPIVEALQRKCSQVEGYTFSASSKQKLMEGLSLAIQGREITFPDGVIKSELEEFEYQYTRTGVRYSAPAGFNDDCVMALALARHKLRQVLPNYMTGDLYSAPKSSSWIPDDEDEFEDDYE